MADLLSDIDEFAHLIKHLAAQQDGDFTATIYGHVASYDPKLHRIRVILPSLRDQNGVPMLSPWAPLGTVMVGPGIGFQYAPKGGATVGNPTAGELAKISIVDRDGSVEIGASLHFTEQMLPPFQTMQPGELGIKGAQGSKFYMAEDGTTTIDTSAASGSKVIVNAAGDVDLTTQTGSVNIVSVGGNVNVTAEAQIVLAGGGPQVARVGDTTTCPAGVGTITSGSSKVQSG